MVFNWEQAFSRVRECAHTDPDDSTPPIQLSSLDALKNFLDWVQIKHCLLRPYFEQPDYPLVEARELLPSFEADPFEYASLPGFSMVALDRPLDYFAEVFQFDMLHDLLGETHLGLEQACPLERAVQVQNRQAFLDRLPKYLQEDFKKQFVRQDLTAMENYPAVLSYLLHMDRAHVVSKDKSGQFHLSGIYASLPSDLDSEIKRFGLQIRKFAIADNARYELNRQFVYRFLMELHGFPIVSERRTSAALFARRLHRMGERFMVRVLGQSDRTITTLWSDVRPRRFPRVEKLALVQVDEEMKDARRILGRGRYFVDKKKRVVILRVVYRQHKYNKDNVRQDRALSVLRQEVVHPLYGTVNARVNLIKDTTNMFLRLNDIVRGEFNGRIVYKRNEVVENTETDEKRLKFLFAWLSKHQRRIIGYSDDFYANIAKVLDHYLFDPARDEVFQALVELHHEVLGKHSYIQQARKIMVLEGLARRTLRGRRVDYLEMLEEANEIMHQLKFEIVNYFEELVDNAMAIAESILHNAYLRRTYLAPREDELSDYGREVRRQYGRLVSLLDEFEAIRKSRSEQGDKPQSLAV